MEIWKEILYVCAFLIVFEFLVFRSYFELLV